MQKSNHCRATAVSYTHLDVYKRQVITPAFCNPMKAIKSPIPAPMAFFRESGMALRMASRKLERVSRINRRPSISTAVNANSQVLPIPRQTAVSYTHLDVYKRQGLL